MLTPKRSRDEGDQDGHHGKTYNLTGEHLVNGSDIAQKASQVLGMKLQFKDIPRDEAKRILEDQEDQLDQTEIKVFLELFEMAKKNELEVVSKDYEKIVGKRPMTVEEWFKRHHEHFRK